jgi:hypothetical protein
VTEKNASHQAGSPEPSGLNEPCANPRCQRFGFVAVSTFLWLEDRHFLWQCRACGHSWTTRERRDAALPGGSNRPRD